VAGIEFEIKGIDELIKQLEELGVRVEKTQREALQSGAEILVDVMQGNAPEGETGQLKSGVQIVGGIKGSGKSLRARIGPKLPKRYYAGYVEYGTYKMPGQPFIFRSYKQALPSVQAAMQAVMKGAFK